MIKVQPIITAHAHAKKPIWVITNSTVKPAQFSQLQAQLERTHTLNVHTPKTRKFTVWIEENFHATPLEIINTYCGGDDLLASIIREMIYVDLYEYFCGNHCDRCTNAYYKIMREMGLLDF